MDDLAAPLPSSTSSIKSARFTWPSGPSKRQSFSLPSSIIYYILKNPSSPGGYNKLSQSCKYFFEGNPILVIASMYGNSVCSNIHFDGSQECCVKFDISKVSSKIWLTHGLFLTKDSASDFTALLCPKLFQCDILVLKAADKVVMFDDFKDLSASAVVVSLASKIIYNDGGVVMLEKLVESLPMSTKHFHIGCDKGSPMISDTSMKTIAQLENFQQFQSLYMLKIPETAITADLSNMIKDNKDIVFMLYFVSDLSDGYKQELGDLVDAIIESNVPNRLLLYRGLDKEKYKIMKSRHIHGDVFVNFGVNLGVE